eukprot:TRINITY_DN5529_c0_g1_i1.p1 TRINITY_DN5529_c0_g1~~TRINITY_DN5529_c0_g1_i1.p1  ORF type:complete len:189 (-),score=17.63 TRINITY_DN5529_c0_g1_i1:137-703(-)
MKGATVPILVLAMISFANCFGMIPLCESIIQSLGSRHSELTNITQSTEKSSVNSTLDGIQQLLYWFPTSCNNILIHAPKEQASTCEQAFKSLNASINAALKNLQVFQNGKLSWALFSRNLRLVSSEFKKANSIFAQVTLSAYKAKKTEVCQKKVKALQQLTQSLNSQKQSSEINRGVVEALGQCEYQD